MIFKVFAIRDMKAEAFLPPYFSPTVGIAIRSFTDAVNSPEGPFGKYPDDFTLFEVGQFDDGTGVLEAVSPIKTVINALEVVQPKGA